MSNYYISFYKRFAKGEQFIYINKRTHKVEEENKNYYWEERQVFNHIEPLIQLIYNKYGKISDQKIFGKSGFVSLLEPYQRNYNNLKNKKSEYINRLMYPVLVVEDGSVDTESLEEDGLQAGKILVYRQGSNIPDFIKNQNQKEIFEILENEETNILKQFNDIYYKFIELLGEQKWLKN